MRTSISSIISLFVALNFCLSMTMDLSFSTCSLIVITRPSKRSARCIERSASGPVNATIRLMPFAIASSTVMTSLPIWPTLCKWLKNKGKIIRALSATTLMPVHLLLKNYYPTIQASQDPKIKTQTLLLPPLALSPPLLKIPHKQRLAKLFCSDDSNQRLRTTQSSVLTTTSPE